MGRLSVGLFVLAGILINLAQLFRYLALGTAAVSVVTPVIATSPIFALLFSFAFVRRLETFSWRVVLAGGLAVLSIYLVS
jgi:drug/metabolite transporter (DMT)-like permease